MKEQRLCNSRAQSLDIMVLKILAEGNNEEGRVRGAEVYNFPDKSELFL